jgi:hypothetical protein
LSRLEEVAGDTWDAYANATFEVFGGRARVTIGRFRAMKNFRVVIGRTEGYNHGLRAILWRAYGMVNLHHFRLRVLDRFGQPAKA